MSIVISVRVQLVAVQHWPWLGLLQYVSSINIACGYHAGDPDTAVRIMKAAVPLNIAIGAHPSFRTGNTSVEWKCIDGKRLYRIIYEQLEALGSIAIQME